MTQYEADRLLSRAEVEKTFGISKRYLESAARCKEGPRIIRIGRSVRYRIGDIRDWIDRCATEAPGEGRVVQ